MQTNNKTTIPTLMKGINKEFDRLYTKYWVNATDDVCNRPLDFPVSYDPLGDTLVIKPSKKLILIRQNNAIKIWKDNVGKYGSYLLLKKENIDFIKDVYEKVKRLK